jgi:acyl carrier protein
MNHLTAKQKVRACLKAVKPAIDLDSFGDDDALLETRIITSLDVLDLVIHLEQARGQSITAGQLVAGSFRDVNTIARVFLAQDEQS